MWAVMMVGMMTPSVAPMVLLYATVGRNAAASGRPLAATGWFLAGYLSAWVSNLHLQPKNGGWRARVLVPVELQATLGKKLFSTPVWRVTKSEAAVLAYPEVQKFEAQGSLNRLAFPSVRGISTVPTATHFTALIEEWARKKRIDNPQTKQKVETHFKSLADFIGHDDGAKVTSQNIVAFEKHLSTTPDPRTGKLRHPNTIPLTYRVSREFSPSPCNRSCWMRTRWIRSQSARRSTASASPSRWNK
jgi:hypothetical protein